MCLPCVRLGSNLNVPPNLVRHVGGVAFEGRWKGALCWLCQWFMHGVMSRVKRSFWKSTFSLFANVSCETLFLEVYILTFCECLV